MTVLLFLLLTLGSVTGPGEKVTVQVDGGTVTLLFPRLEEAEPLDPAALAELQGLLEDAGRRMGRLRPDEETYVGRVGRLHVGAGNPTDSRYPVPHVLLYLVMPDHRNAGIHLDQEGLDDLLRLLRKAGGGAQGPANAAG